MPGARARVDDGGIVEICDTAADGHHVAVEFYLNGDSDTRVAIRLYGGAGDCTGRRFGGSSIRFRATVFEGSRREDTSRYVSTSLPDNSRATLLYNGNDTDRPECSYANGAKACWPFAHNRQVMKVCDTRADGHHARVQAYIQPPGGGPQTRQRTELHQFGGRGSCGGLLLQGAGTFAPARYRAASFEGDRPLDFAPYETNTDGT